MRKSKSLKIAAGGELVIQEMNIAITKKLLVYLPADGFDGLALYELIDSKLTQFLKVTSDCFQFPPKISVVDLTCSEFIEMSSLFYELHQDFFLLLMRKQLSETKTPVSKS